jgi:hypothetical protein
LRILLIDDSMGLRARLKGALRRSNVDFDALDLTSTGTESTAQGAHDALRVEVEAEGLCAGRGRVTTRRARTETALEQLTSAFLAAQMRIKELEQAQAAGEATRRALETEIVRQQYEIGARDRALVQAWADFSRELEKLRASAEFADERLRAAERRALLEIERKRTAGSRSQKEVRGSHARGRAGRTPAPAGTPGAAISTWRRAASRWRNGGESGRTL